MNKYSKLKVVLIVYILYLGGQQGFGQDNLMLANQFTTGHIDAVVPQKRTISTQAHQERSMEVALIELEKKYNIHLNYDWEIVKGKTLPAKLVWANQNDVNDALRTILTPFGLVHKRLKKNYYTIFPADKVESNQKEDQLTRKRDMGFHLPNTEAEDILLLSEAVIEKNVAGVVLDKQNIPIPGVNILVKNSDVGTVTDVDGRFALAIPDDKNILVFSFIGYLTQEIELGNQTYITVNLVEESTRLNELVVVGYGAQRKRDLTGAVSSLNTSDVNRAVTTSAEELFQGRVSGVTVTQNSNAPGGGITVRVRGTGSINSANEPLYVIDGIPIANTDQQNNTQSDIRFGGRNPQLSPLALINPQDIASIEVLKDASAAAIYGARGANGVILITTKKGTSGDAKIEWNSSYGIQEADLLPELLNAQQFVALNDEARKNAGRPLIFDGNVPPFDTDWQSELYRTAVVQNHGIGIRGGDKTSTYAFSFGYFNQEGVVIGNDLERYAARINFEKQAKKWLKTGINLNVSRTTQNNPITLGPSSVTANANRMLPIGPVVIGREYFQNTDMVVENYNYRLQNAGITVLRNPIYYADIVNNESLTNRALGSIFLELKLSDHLKFTTTPGIDLINNHLLYFAPSTASDGSKSTNVLGNTLHWSIQNQLTYQRGFGRHNITATVVQQAERFRFSQFQLLAENTADVLGNFSFDGDTRETNDKVVTASNWSLVSFLGRVNYDFDRKYLLSASIRRDGSSRFGDDKKFGIFPAVSLGWVISEESFFTVPFISFLKIRSGYGVNGNQDIAAFRYLSLLRGTRAVIKGNLFPGVEPSNIPNAELGWESTSQLNIGLDARFFEDRFNLSFNWYDKNTSDLLLNTNIPLSSGFPSIFRNIGEINNRGIELELDGILVQKGGFRWSAAVNYSVNRNEIKQLDGVNNEIIVGSFILRKGESINSFFGYRVDGLWQAEDDIKSGPMPNALPGDRKFVDTNGDGVINASDRIILGSILPDISYGVSNNFSFKGLDFGIFLQGLAGFEQLNALKTDMENTSGAVNTSTRVLNRWTPENTNTEVERADQRNRANVPADALINSYFVEDASFLRLKNVSLAYNFPTSMISKWKIASLRLSVVGQNLATFTNFSITDPEAGDSINSYPLVRSFTFGLNVGF